MPLFLDDCFKKTSCLFWQCFWETFIRKHLYCSQAPPPRAFRVTEGQENNVSSTSFCLPLTSDLLSCTTEKVWSSRKRVNGEKVICLRRRYVGRCVCYRTLNTSMRRDATSANTSSRVTGDADLTSYVCCLQLEVGYHYLFVCCILYSTRSIIVPLRQQKPPQKINIGLQSRVQRPCQFL